MLASIAALAASAGGVGVALLGTPQILWASLGFSLIALVAALIGVLAGMGRFAGGYGMTGLCVGGTIAVAAGFAMLDFRSNLGSSATLARLVMPWVGVQLISAAAIVGGGGLAVLARRPASWGLIAKGLALLVPAGAILAGGYLGRGLIPEGENGSVVALGVLVVGGIIVGLLVSIGGHLLIRAFEFTAEDR